jgi:hypothetical protein
VRLELGAVGHDDCDFMIIGVNGLLHGAILNSRSFFRFLSALCRPSHPVLASTSS